MSGAWQGMRLVCGGSVALLAIALAAIVSGCFSRRAPEGPNVLLVVLDTARRDRFSLYGYERETTPHLEELAASSTVYEKAYSTSSWTAPSHASLFTGLYPYAHRVTQAAWDLPAARETLAEVLRRAGYDTIGIVGNPMVGRRLGFDQGFEEFHETWDAPIDRKGEHPAVAHLEQFLDSHGDDPFLAFVNLIEPHNPYTSGKEFRAEFVGENPPALERNHWRAFYRNQKQLTPR